MRRWDVICLAAGLLFVVVQVSAQQTKQGAGQRATGGQTAGTAGGNAEHGRYIVEHIAMCFECHSPRDENGNIIESQKYLGGPIPVRPSWGANWAIKAPRNKGLPGYTDDLAFRLLMQGSIGREGQQLRPPMPRFYMNRQDAADVIAFMRSMP